MKEKQLQRTSSGTLENCLDLDFIGGVLWENWEGKRRNVGLGDNIIITLRASQAREQRQKHRDGQTCTTPRGKDTFPGSQLPGILLAGPLWSFLWPGPSACRVGQGKDEDS